MIDFSLNALPQAIPFVSDYQNLLNTELFLEMESFSNTFLKTHGKLLKNYASAWVADPFHQWSRQWEYPFAYSYIYLYVMSYTYSKFIHSDNKIRILDGGSGCTFFPYYLRYKHPTCRVYCCDCDSSLAPIFLEINNKMANTNVEFDVYALERLTHKDNFFDIIYCISVLEHTRNYVDIIKQFKRVLNPDGLLIVTFDVSLDNKTAIDRAQGLLDKLNNEFKAAHPNFCQDLFRNIQNPDILTTEFARTFDKKLLPWKLTCTSFVRQLLELKLPKTPFHNLTIFCGTWKKDGKMTPSEVKHPSRLAKYLP